MMNRWVWVFGEAESLRWVVENATMAFADHAAGRIRPMAAGDTAVLYVTRGAHHNPTRDVARLAGIATVMDEPTHKPEPIEIAGRDFAFICSIRVNLLHGLREGPPVKSLVERLEFVRKPESWGAYFRTSPIRVSEADWQVLSDAVGLWQPAG